MPLDSRLRGNDEMRDGMEMNDLMCSICARLSKGVGFAPMLHEWLMIGSVVLVGATIQSAAGFGFGVMVIPTVEAITMSIEGRSMRLNLSSLR